MNIYDNPMENSRDNVIFQVHCLR